MRSRVSLPVIGRLGVFQLPDRDLLLPGSPIGAQIRGAAAVYGMPDDYEDVARTLGLTTGLGKRPATLSHGERRRATMSVALARRPDVLIAQAAALNDFVFRRHYLPAALPRVAPRAPSRAAT